MLFAAAGIVYWTGGTRHAYLHALYIPAVLAGGLFGLYGGLIAGAVGGVLIGPFMPLDVDSGLMQSPVNWMFRLVFLAATGGVAGWITDHMRRQHSRVAWLNNHEAISGFPNRQQLLKALRAVQQEGERPYKLFLVQVNNFEHIQAALGGHLAHQLRRTLAEQLKAILCSTGVVYDLHAQKLALVVEEPEGSFAACLERLRKLSQSPISVEDVPIYADISIGSADLDEAKPKKILHRANIALFRACEQGRLHVAYSPADDALQQRNMAMLIELPAAARKGELWLAYQPKIALDSGRAVGVETLLRWTRADGSPVSPADFIPVVENTALIDELTRWVIIGVFAELQTLKDAGTPLSVAINLSPRNLQDADLVPFIREALEAHGISPGLVEFEITESAFLDLGGTQADRLQDLRALGVKVSIDDFGTGYTTLRYLSDLPADTIKIDRVFIKEILADARQRTIVEAVIGLAKELGLETVAEGIEDEATAALLREMGCGIAQGFHYSRPLSAAQLSDWLQSQTKIPLEC